MQFELKIRETKHRFEPKYDDHEMRSNVMHMIATNEQRASRRGVSSPRKSRTWLLVGVASLPLLVGFGYSSFTWFNVRFQFDRAPVSYQANTETIVQSFLRPQIDEQKLTLFEARLVSGFPIPEPQTVPGWKKIESVGLSHKIPSANGANTSTESSQMVVVYMDEYMNRSNQKVLVIQQIDNVLTATSQIPFDRPTIGFPSNSRKVRFGNSLGVFVPSPTGMDGFLRVYDSIGNQVTDIDIYGNSKSEMERFASAYLKAPTR